MNKTVSESYILLEEILLYKLSPEEELFITDTFECSNIIIF